MKKQRGFYFIGMIVCLCSMVQMGWAADKNVSDVVKANINTLIQTKNCPGCDLTNANLNRLDLSNAILEGANLTGATIFLTDMTGANLKNANLQRTGFGGTDIAGADLRGADLRGANLSGAYVTGAKFDGEFISTSPFENEGITEIEKKVYVEDTVKPKKLPVQKEVTIGQRRDFQETPPVITEKSNSTVQTEIVPEQPAVIMEDKETVQVDSPGDTWKVKEQSSAPVKLVQPVQENVELGNTIMPMTEVLKKDIPQPPAAITTDESETVNTEESGSLWESFKKSIGIESKGKEANEEKSESDRVEERENRVAKLVVSTDKTQENVEPETLEKEIQAT